MQSYFYYRFTRLLLGEILLYLPYCLPKENVILDRHFGPNARLESKNIVDIASCANFNKHLKK